MKKCVKAIIICFLFLLFSCNTARLFTDSEYMHIMVYDLTGSPVSGMSFFVDGKNAGETDVYGRLTLLLGLNTDTDEHEITGKKESYADVSSVFVKKAGLVLYFKTGTVQMYLDSAESAVDKGYFETALSYIEEAEKMDKSEDVLLFKAIVLKKSGKVDEYEELIKRLKYSKTIKTTIGENL